MTNPEHNPDVYQLLFDQTPVVIRWLLGVLTLGLFSLAGWVWKRQESQMDKVRKELHERMDREMSGVYNRLDYIAALQSQILTAVLGDHHDRRD